MKKKIFFILFVFLIHIGIASVAEAGVIRSVAGYYYYTDIVTYLWDVPVNSINIGGRTLLDAESLTEYGFTVTWHPNERWLEIVDNSTFGVTEKALSGELLDKAGGVVGKVAGAYYNTDIVTTLNGEKTTSYNIGGRTFIEAEGMRNHGYIVLWDPEKRTLSITSREFIDKSRNDNDNTWSILLYNSTTLADQNYEGFWFVWKRDWINYDTGLKGYGINLFSHLNLSQNTNGKVILGFSFYQNIAQQYSCAISEILDSLVSYKYGEIVQEAAKVVDSLNEHVEIYINGEKVKIAELHKTRGNDHIDYYFILEDSFSKDFVDSIAMRCGVMPDRTLEDFYEHIPEVTDGNLSVYQKALNEIYNIWNLKIGYQTETDICHIIYGMQTGTPHGTFRTLRLVYKEDGKVVHLLGNTGLSNIWGIHPELYDISLSEDEKTLYFSCSKDGIEHSFSVDLATAEVKKLESN